MLWFCALPASSSRFPFSSERAGRTDILRVLFVLVWLQCICMFLALPREVIWLVLSFPGPSCLPKCTHLCCCRLIYWQLSKEIWLHALDAFAIWLPRMSLNKQNGPCCYCKSEGRPFRARSSTGPLHFSEHTHQRPAHLLFSARISFWFSQFCWQLLANWEISYPSYTSWHLAAQALHLPKNPQQTYLQFPNSTTLNC